LSPRACNTFRVATAAAPLGEFSLRLIGAILSGAIDSARVGAGRHAPVLVGAGRLGLRGPPGVCELVEEPVLDVSVAELELGAAGALALHQFLEDLLRAHVRDYPQAV
jgi:hypothetical protein